MCEKGDGSARRPWETPMQYNEDRFDDTSAEPVPAPSKRPASDPADQPHPSFPGRDRGEAFGVDEDEPPRKRRWEGDQFQSKDTEPLNYRTGDPGAEFGVDDED